MWHMLLRAKMEVKNLVLQLQGVWTYCKALQQEILQLLQKERAHH
jgi:hypothetical protein